MAESNFHVGDLQGQITELSDHLAQITSLALFHEAIKVSSITFSQWVTGIYYSDISFDTTYNIADAASIIVQSNSTQLWVVSSGKNAGENKTVRCRVVSPLNTQQTNVYFKVLYTAEM